jgi:transformer-2 protein
MRTTIQIGNLSNFVDDRALAELFAPHGIVHSAKVSTHFDSGQSTGAGFVEMESGNEGEAAIAALNGRTHCGRILSVCWSEPCANPDERPEQLFGPMNMADVIAPPEEKPERRGLP